jgi:5-methylcytosine-specific restriction endonuclease McrA
MLLHIESDRMNRWGISAHVELMVRKRDKKCVYCRAPFKQHIRGRGGRVKIATWEHIDNDGGSSEHNVALCCGACNSSKGTKALGEWLRSEYCRKNNINPRRVAPVVRNWMKRRSR